MFSFAIHNRIHHCCSNPFGATIANPRINFALALAAATTMPYAPSYPVFGFGFNYGYYPSYSFNPCFNYYNQPFLGYSVPAYYSFNNFHLLNNVYSTPVVRFNDTSLISIPSSNSNNPFGYFNNTNNITIPKSRTTTSSSNNTRSQKTQSNQEISEDTTVNTSGKKLNKNNNEYGPEFLAKVKQIAQRLNCDYRDLLGLMNSESGINAQAKNPTSSATGLIQFIESTARSLGTSTAELRQMSPIEQLDYVEKYLATQKANAGISGKLSAGDLYALTFLPARASRNVLTSSGEKYYACNKGLDTNKDGQITKDELGQRIINKRVSDNSFLA